MKAKKIAVLMGGPSAEREVSLNTGAAILKALQERGYNAVGMELEPERLVQQLTEESIDVVFNAIHGKYGEDGVLQGALELLDIPYTGSGVMASAMAMDKGITKKIFMASQIPTPRSVIYTKADYTRDLAAEITREFTIPVVVKAAAQGSSIGVAIVEAAAELPAALADGFKYSDTVLVEEFINGREFTVAVWGQEKAEALPIVEIVPHSGRYDYHSKYTKGATNYIVPAQIGAEQTLRMQEAALKAFDSLGCTGIARVDVMMDDAGNPYVLEVNTVPGMTATSLVPKAAAAAGISFGELCERLLGLIAR